MVSNNKFVQSEIRRFEDVIKLTNIKWGNKNEIMHNDIWSEEEEESE
jgi:hypothetical protein